MSRINILEFTLECLDDWEDQKNQIISLYPTIVKAYVFQREEGGTGYKHFQGRVSVVKKDTSINIVNLVRSKNLLEKFYAKPTSNNCLKNDREAFYCIKELTRTDGPWKDTDEVLKIPRQVREIKELYPWQIKVRDSVSEWDTRSINIIIDKRGNCGKSTLVMYLRAYKLARKIPYSNDYKDIMRMVCDMPESNCYIFDMPRAINKEKLYQFYSAIEEIKGGYAFDDRYSFKEKIFDCPVIWVFTNEAPDPTLLSKDRWRYWHINKDNDLLKVPDEYVGSGILSLI